MTLAAALVAAGLGFAPSAAHAQAPLLPGAGGVYFTNPNYVAPSYRTSYLYYQYGLPYNPLVNNPFMYSAASGPGLYSVGYGYGGAYGPSFSYGGTYGVPAGVGGYGSVFSPFAGTPNFYRPTLGFSGYGSYVAAMDYAGIPVYGGYPSYLYPNFAGFNSLFPSYVYTGNYTPPPFGGDYAGLPMMTGGPALSLAGLSTNAFTPGVDLTGILSPIRTSTGFPMISPQGVRGGVSEAAPPRMRTAMYPVIAATPGSVLYREKPAAAPGPEPAAIEVTVPDAKAELLFQGVKTTRTGKVREFESPPLQQGRTFTYQVQVRWMAGGEPRTLTRQVAIRAGERVHVDFTSK
jgi:uncharacterized protein (TIGR03000 family)